MYLEETHIRELATGEAGFIGSHIFEHALSEGYEVVCLDNSDSYYDPVIIQKNIQVWSKNNPFTLHQGDISDRSSSIITHSNSFKGDAEHPHANYEKAEREFHWKPVEKIDEGLRSYAECVSNYQL